MTIPANPLRIERGLLSYNEAYSLIRHSISLCLSSTLSFAGQYGDIRYLAIVSSLNSEIATLLQWIAGLSSELAHEQSLLRK